MNLITRRLDSRPWDDWVRRVILHVPHYLSPDGEPTSGGRQRNVRDIGTLIKEEWGRECIVVQKAHGNWERQDRYGLRVKGLQAPLSVYGDPVLGLATARLVRQDDAVLYLGGEDAWPFIIENAKAFHVGVWWDGPFPGYKKWLTTLRTKSLFHRCRSVACCDTNVINWLRTQAGRYYQDANRAVYIPNCVDLSMLPEPTDRHAPNTPLRILFARRFERKRGPELILDALSHVKKQGVPFKITMSTAEGQIGSEKIERMARRKGVWEYVTVETRNLDTVLELYTDADIAVVPTLWSEGTSYSCVEALASGLPVVTTTVGGLPNLVLPGFNGFVARPSPGPVADAIIRLTDRTVWRQLHRNALRTRSALSKTRWESEVLAWLKL